IPDVDGECRRLARVEDLVRPALDETRPKCGQLVGALASLPAVKRKNSLAADGQFDDQQRGDDRATYVHVVCTYDRALCFAVPAFRAHVQENVAHFRAPPYCTGRAECA